MNPIYLTYNIAGTRGDRERERESASNMQIFIYNSNKITRCMCWRREPLLLNFFEKV